MSAVLVLSNPFYERGNALSRCDEADAAGACVFNDTRRSLSCRSCQGSQDIPHMKQLFFIYL